jgi:pimeloyl-ACP methyl ester carboxylesterase
MLGKSNIHSEMIKIDGIYTSVTRRNSNMPVLLCIHGNSLSQQTYASLWSDPRFDNYAVITYDLPGHGKSKQPSNPEKSYCFSGYARHLTALVTYFGLEEYIIIGHSLGGHIALQCVVELGLTGLCGLFLMGTPPLSRLEDTQAAFNPLPEGASFFSGPMTDEGAEFLAAKLDRRKSEQKELKKMLIATDPEARTNLTKNLAVSGLKNEKKWIKESKLPIRLLFGENDSLINPDYINDPSFQEILGSRRKLRWLPETEHMPVWNHSPGYADELLSFLNK